MSAVLAKYDFDYLPAAEMIGADRTIKKPFLPDDIVRIVQDLLTE